jgi:hypothetical protein
LHDWSFGGRGIKALEKAGLRAICFGKLKFFRGSELIRVLEAGGGQPDSESSDLPEFSPAIPSRNGKALPRMLQTTQERSPAGGDPDGLEEI